MNRLNATLASITLMLACTGQAEDGTRDSGVSSGAAAGEDDAGAVSVGGDAGSLGEGGANDGGASQGGAGAHGGAGTDGGASGDGGATMGGGASGDGGATMGGGASGDGAGGTGNAGAGGYLTPRLEPWQLETDGADPLVLGIYDSKEHVRCRFLLDSAGQLRCLPAGPPSLAIKGSYFVDAECKRPIYTVDPEEAQAVLGKVFAFPLPAENCQPTRYVIASFSTLPLTGPDFGDAYLLTQSGGCLKGVSLRGYDAPIELRVNEIESPDRWITGKEVESALFSGRIRLIQIEAADGTRFDDHLVDERWDMGCTLGTKFNNFACFPPAIEYSDPFFADSACESSTIWPIGNCSPPAYILPSWDKFELYGLGAQYTGTLYRGNRGGSQSCELLGDTSYLGNFVELGPKLNDAIQVLTWQNQGTERLQLRSLSGSETFEPIANPLTIPDRDQAPRYHDSVTGEDCDAIWTPEGKVRCVPLSVPKLTDNDTFLDPDCTKPYYGNYGRFTSGEAMVVESLQFGEQHAVSLHNFVSVPASTILYNRIGEICGPLNNPIESYPEPGPDISWDAYPLLDEVNAGPLGAAPLSAAELDAP